MRFIFALFISTLYLSSLFTLEQVGKLTGFSGEVTIDAQGKGEFIKPIVGDLLYNNTVIKTGKNSTAAIILHTREMQILPDSLIQIADILQTESIKAQWGSNVYTQLETCFKNILAKFFLQIEKKEKGTVETNFGKGIREGFIDTGDADETAFNMAREELLKENYRNALKLLSAVYDPSGLQLPPGEYNLLIALCYFFLDCHRQAADFFTKAGAELTRDNAPVWMADLLILPAGISCYLTNNNDKALLYFKQFLQTGKENTLMPFGYHLLCRTLLCAGQNREAKSYLQEALLRFKDHPLYQEWTRLLRGL